MEIAGVSLLAVLVAAIASYAFGSAWYMTLGTRWMAAADLTEEDLQGMQGVAYAAPFIIAFVAQLVMAFMLAGLVGHLGEFTIRNGLISGVSVWFGFVLTSMAVNYAFQGRKPMLSVIDGGHWLGVLTIQGLVIGWLG